MANAGAPAAASEIAAFLSATSQKPICRLVQTSAQLMTDNVASPLSFTSEDVDTHGFHDNSTNPSRITPTKAGWYRFYGTYYTAVPTTLVVVYCFLRKNGSTTYAPGPRSNSGALAQSVSTTALISCNGSGDYVELMGVQDSSGNVNTNVSLYFSSVLECEFVRDL